MLGASGRPVLHLAFFASLLVACPPAEAPVAPIPPDVARWRSDLELLVHDVETVHPAPYTKTNKASFLERLKSLSDALPTLTEEQRVVRAMQLVASLGDGHTQLAPHRPDFGDWYPIRVYEFTDGYFVTSAFKTDSDLAGAQILMVAGRPVTEAMTRARSLMGADNAFGDEEHLFAFSNAALMRGLGIAEPDRSLRVTFRLKDGRTVERRLRPRRADDTRFEPGDSLFDWRFVSEVFGPPLGGPADWTTAFKGLLASDFRKEDRERPLHLVYRRPFVALPLADRHAYYMQINNVADTPDETFRAFFRRAMAEVDLLRPERLIIDLRYNPGGDGSETGPMIHELIKREEMGAWKDLFVLTGRKTFSAAVMFLQAYLDNTEVTVLGEPAGAGPDSYGDATTLELTRTGLELTVSTLFHKLDDHGERPDVTPVAVPAPFSFADYAAGRDPALDPILRGEEVRSLPILAVADGPAAARSAYVERTRRYAGRPDWLPPRRIEMLRALWALRDAHRLEDAADLGVLLTDLYPQWARAWSVRGDAEDGAGRKAEAKKSYRRALEIDPNNIDASAQRRAVANP